MPYRPRRSVLYVPGSHARALEKAGMLDADSVILDLEDAVAPAAKHAARAAVCAAVREDGFGNREVILRINALDTPWGAEDLAAAAHAGPDAMLIPKISAPEQLDRVAAALGETGAPAGIALWAMIETPLAIMNIREIAAWTGPGGKRLSCLVIGSNDLIKDSRLRPTADRALLIPWLMSCVAAARAFDLSILDGVFNDFSDEDGFIREARQGADMGMDGKTLIHPRQLGPCNRIFSPTAAEIDQARRILDAFAKAENQGKGVISLDGRMVELLHADAARRVIAIADRIAGTSGAGTPGAGTQR